jgi:hypothetical protein
MKLYRFITYPLGDSRRADLSSSLSLLIVMRLPQPWMVKFLPLVFLPAWLGLIVQAVTADEMAERLLSLALMLFCPELGYMARVDFENILAIANASPDNAKPDNASPDNASPKESKADLPDIRLNHFYKVTTSTIVLEIVGFYTALFNLPVGAVLIIASQLWFNLFAGVQLWPTKVPAITDFGIANRKSVLIANGIALTLLCFWPIASVQLFVALGLLVLITLFLFIKYGSQSVLHPPS